MSVHCQGLQLGPHGDPATTSLTMWTSVQIYSDFAFVLLADVFTVCDLVALVFCLFPSYLEANWNRTYGLGTSGWLPRDAFFCSRRCDLITACSPHAVQGTLITVVSPSYS